jgi:hypothetical protein
MGLAIRIVMMVGVIGAVAVFLSLGNFIIDDGCGCGKITINIASPQMDHREDVDPNVWDATLNINKVTPKDEWTRWEDIRVVVKSMEGMVLVEHSRLEVNDPSGYYPHGSWDSQIRFWFVEAGDNHRIDALDAIVISGLTPEFEGATIEFTTAGERIGSITLPTMFE